MNEPEIFLRPVLSADLPSFLRISKTPTRCGWRRVLEKCDFHIIDHLRGFANARGTEIDELLLRYDEAPAPTTP